MDDSTFMQDIAIFIQIAFPRTNNEEEKIVAELILTQDILRQS